MGTYLYGRRLYEVMAFWETLDLRGQPTFITEFAEMWRKADKVVYPHRLTAVSSARTRIEHVF